LTRGAPGESGVNPAVASAIREAADAAVRAGGGAGDVALLSPTAGAVLGGGLPITALVSVDGYGEALEREADAEALTWLAGAGYDPYEAPRVFERLLRDSDERGPIERFPLGSGRWLMERLDSIREILRSRHPRAPDGLRASNDGDFGRRMRAVVRENAALDGRVGRFGLARTELARVLAAAPEDPIAHLHLGDLDRRESQAATGDAAEALAARARAHYERAIALDPSFAEPYRELGLLHYQLRDRARARAAFERYLALSPDAPDTARIREYVLDLGP
jgi:predicted Zn-dependent protease